MKIIDRGGGTPIVVIPGVQGRWEWMAPAIDALAQRCRVVTFSLADEPACGGRVGEAPGFDCYVGEGRGGWVAPAIDALAQRCRVVTFSLADEPSCGGRFDEAHGFDCYVEQVRD